MKLVVAIIISILTFFNAVAQDVVAIVKEADRLEAVPDELAALAKFKEALRVKPTHIHALSKSSELCSRIGQRQTNTKVRDEYYKAAKIYAETALMVDSTNSEANTSMAIADPAMQSGRSRRSPAYLRMMGRKPAFSKSALALPRAAASL